MMLLSRQQPAPRSQGCARHGGALQPVQPEAAKGIFFLSASLLEPARRHGNALACKSCGEQGGKSGLGRARRAVVCVPHVSASAVP